MVRIRGFELSIEDRIFINDAGVGKVVAFAVADTSAAGLTTVLFNGITGYGFIQT